MWTNLSVLVIDKTVLKNRLCQKVSHVHESNKIAFLDGCKDKLQKTRQTHFGQNKPPNSVKNIRTCQEEK